MVGLCSKHINRQPMVFLERSFQFVPDPWFPELACISHAVHVSVGLHLLFLWVSSSSL